MTRLLVYGMATTGVAVARAALQRGWDVVAADDTVSDAGRESAIELGLDVVERPDADELDRLVRGVDVVSPSPGVPEHHRLIAACVDHGVSVRTELDLAYDWEQEHPHPRPFLAITGTDGKTTVTTLADQMVTASGRRSVAAGNTDVPLVAALDLDVEVFVVEATSFRLRFIDSFAPAAATWLNLASDHLDWHGTQDAYGRAKARIFEHQGPDDTAIGFADDAVVMSYLASAPARHRTFSVRAVADYHQRDSVLMTPHGELIDVGEMWRALPHDRTNALAAAATVLESGVATLSGVREALRSFAGVAHRISFVTERDGVRFYDDSKATTPHAALTAIRGFDSVVLIAGGRNKDLDLRAMAAEPGRMRAVVALGEAAPEVVSAFAGVCPIAEAGHSMEEAVRLATLAAHPGDVVLLSPGCASWDMYNGYALRGEDFARCVNAMVMGRR